MSEDSIRTALEQLISGATATPSGRRIPKTRQVLNHLDQIEEALGRSVGRAAIAETFGWSLSTFDAALYRARNLREAGGDRRLRTAAQPPEPKNAREISGKPTTSIPPSALRKPL